MLGLKHRSDRRDAMALSASLTGFDVEFVDGFNRDEVSEDFQPPVRVAPSHARRPWPLMVIYRAYILRTGN